MTDKYIKVKIYNLDAGAQAQAWGNQTTSTPTRPTGIKRQGQGGRVGQRIKGETPPFQFYNYYNVTEDVDQTKEGLKSIKKGNTACIKDPMLANNNHIASINANLKCHQ